MPKISRSGTHVQSSLLSFELAQETDPGLTSYAGLPLLIETWSALGMPEVVERELRLKKYDRGPSEAEWVEVLTMLPLIGGKTVEDLRVLKEDSGVMRLWPVLGKLSPRSALDFLERFHDPEQEGSSLGKAVIREETAPLKKLATINKALVAAIQQRKPERVATIDFDASIHESRKREALPHYDGGRGYQPLLAVWAERRLVVGDQFRDGNVPAGMGNLPFIQRVLADLPPGIKHRYVRGDSALYEQDVLAYLGRERIEFAISADMTPQLRAVVERLPKSAWKPLKDRDGVVREEERFWAEVEYVPEETRPQGTPPFRYVAIRLPKQGELYEEPPTKYVAVVTNRWKMEGNELINWHREKCGTIEHMHDLLKNDLAARSFPSGKFGANAAWYRSNVMANNLQVACALLALEDEQAARVRPATFAFRFVRRAGRVISHARTLFLILCSLSAHLLPIYEAARARLVELVGSQ